MGLRPGAFFDAASLFFVDGWSGKQNRILFVRLKRCLRAGGRREKMPLVAKYFRHLFFSAQEYPLKDESGI